jgi:ubiquinone/menaquinone biosynthesis C-methylase UbiE/uncharacterized protein YbaR (Trm112 family)
MIVSAAVASDLALYVCPVCKRYFDQEDDWLRCAVCNKGYPIRDGIPDFILEELANSRNAVLRRMTTIDKMARIYETRLWYPIVLDIYGGFHSLSLPQLIVRVIGKVQSLHGRLIDIACGPGTYGRRAASPVCEVYGIDVSGGMLRQGAAYVAKEGISNVHFARARVEALPFANGQFEGAICAGSLHLFADTVAALREIARVLKPGAILSVFTFTAGNGGILKYRRVRDWSRRRQGLHVFELPEVDGYLAESGFECFEPEVSGSILTFAARKKRGDES